MHLPVLQKEVIQYLNPKPNENFVDCTFGEGGHSRIILEKIAPNGKLLAIELTPELIERIRFQVSGATLRGVRFASSRFQENLILVNDSYVNLKKIVQEQNFYPVAGILFDLGMSSWHLEESGRGFTFKRDEPLDMRYSKTQNRNLNLKSENKLTAAEIINRWPQLEIQRILEDYGQERFAKEIAKEIVRQREKVEIRTTFQLVEVVKRATPSWYHHKKIHPATKVFQALRIAVNDELNNLKKTLAQALNVLEPGARLVLISFHGLEDKIVKNFFKNKAKEGFLQILTKKAVRPRREEIKLNPSSRSAKLRAAARSDLPQTCGRSDLPHFYEYAKSYNIKSSLDFEYTLNTWLVSFLYFSSCFNE